ncbi:MAG: hypothetical protein Q4B26_18450, partial [Eubacteriales bacterium]|nr:hypothetical protein [Eubacteriales bacterium]
ISEEYQAGDQVDLSVRLGGGEKQLGWSVEQNGILLESYTMLEGDLRLYPVFEEEKTTYQAVFMQETVTGDGYEQVDSATIPAEADDSVSAADVQNSAYGKEYSGFTFDEAASDSTQAIAQDGTTVVQVRFKRNEYQLKFDIDGNYRTVGDADFGQTVRRSRVSGTL